MKILVLTNGYDEDYHIEGLFSHPSDHHWSEAPLRDEFEAFSGFVVPVYQIAENPTRQQQFDGAKTQHALRFQAIGKHWGSSTMYEMAFRKWLTAERGFQPIAWEEI